MFAARNPRPIFFSRPPAKSEFRRTNAAPTKTPIWACKPSAPPAWRPSTCACFAPQNSELLVAQRLDWIQSRCSARGDKTSSQSDRAQCNRHSEISKRIIRTDAKKLFREQSRGGESAKNSDSQAEDD